MNYYKIGTNKLAFYMLLVTFLSSMIGSLYSGGATAEENRFDHFSTGFPLNGAHIRAECESCHIKGLFKGTPSNCSGCHNGRISQSKSARHVASANTCDDCHTAFSWDTSTVDHTAVKGDCRTCHFKLPRGHIATTAQCEECHATIAWEPARFNHDTTTAQCSSCHQKSPTHVTSSNRCDDCHNTHTWEGARFDHSGITESCSNCHQKPIKHIPSSNLCNDCHVTTAWSIIHFDHSSTIAACATCHTKPGNHFPTTDGCERCHDTNSWSRVTFSHTSANYPGDHHSSVSCLDCHAGNNKQVAWSNAGDIPFCIACHLGDYRTGPHTKISSPSTKYTANELKDCSGSCHVYATTTDFNNGVISSRRSGEHNTRDANWD